MKKHIFLLLALIFISAKDLSAQKVLGKVVDDLKEPLPGVSVIVKGTTIGTVTDYNGIYSLDIPDAQKATLIFTYIGMVKQEVALKGRTTLNVEMTSSSIALNEVVAIGYGTSRRGDLTGSVVSVNTDEISKVPATNVAQTLAGRVSGVNVSQSEGDFNAGIQIRVRGGISLTQSNDPLYVVDGFPVSGAEFSTISPSDIASIDILKDASSTAIYGARGANGVVVVSTKSGDSDRYSLSYEGYVGIRKMSKKHDVLSAPEYVFLQYENNWDNYQPTNPDITDPDLIYQGYLDRLSRDYGSIEDIQQNWNGRGVYWQDQTFQNGFIQNHKISASGGNKDLKYSFSYGHQEEEGLMIHSQFKKDNLRLRVDNNFNKWLTLSANVNYTHQETKGMSTSTGNTTFSKMNTIINYPPLMKIGVSDEEYAISTTNELLDNDTGNTMRNPFVSAKSELDKRILHLFSANGSILIKLYKGLTFKNSTGMVYQNQRNDLFYGANSVVAARSTIQGSIRSYERGRIQTSNVLNYDWRSSRQKIGVLLGQEYLSNWDKSFGTSVTNFPNDDIGLNDLSLGIPGLSESSFNDSDKLLSFFGRLNYNYNERYLLTATLRFDGSSKFGDNNKWGIFPSTSFAWRLSEESFIKDLELFSDLKLRVGYGASGNDRIPAYRSLPVWSSITLPSGTSVVPGYVASQVANPNLKWEANKTFNIGLDLGFFDQRLTITPEFYINRSKDLLLNSVLPSSSGYKTMMRNIGSTENKGFDVAINTVNISKKDFTWTTALTLSHNKNKILALSGETGYTMNSGWGSPYNEYLVEVGKTIGLMYGYKTKGLYQVSDFKLDESGNFIPTASGNGFVLKDGVVHEPSKVNEINPGFWKFEDISGPNGEKDGIIDEYDRTEIGNANPIFYGGLNNTFSYKGFDLSVFLNFNFGNDILNANRLYSSLTGRVRNNALGYNSSDNRWITIDGNGHRITDPSQLEAINAGKTVAQYKDMGVNSIQVHSWGVEDGSFLRINNITLGYSFPKKMMKKIYLSNLRIYATVNNLYTFTKYSGLDPEVSTRNATGLTPGVDWSAYPRSTSFVFGLNVTM